MELEQFPILKKFEVVFCDKISVLPPKQYLDFMIDLMSLSTPVSQAPYHMSIPELTKWRIQLEELLDKGCIHPSVSPWRAPVLFVGVLIIWSIVMYYYCLLSRLILWKSFKIRNNLL